MSSITILWTAIGSASLTLAVMHGLVWWKRRTWAEFFFCGTAASAAFFTLSELWLMRANTPAELTDAMRWAHVSIWLMVLGLTGFVRFYFGAGWAPLAWPAVGLRTLLAPVGLLIYPNLNYLAITAVEQVPLWGEMVSVPVGEPNPWMLLGPLSSLAFVLYTGHAAVRFGNAGIAARRCLAPRSRFLFLAPRCRRRWSSGG